MKLEIVDVSRRPQWPLWAVLIVLVWLSLGIAAFLLSSHLGRPVSLCLFKRVTGVPCPTCGFTRGVLCFLRGWPGQAWLHNPLLFSVLTLLVLAAATRILFARCLRILLTGIERVIAWLVVIALFGANWLYVIFCVG